VLSRVIRVLLIGRRRLMRCVLFSLWRRRLRRVVRVSTSLCNNIAELRQHGFFFFSFVCIRELKKKKKKIKRERRSEKNQGGDFIDSKLGDDISLCDQKKIRKKIRKKDIKRVNMKITIKHVSIQTQKIC
jgi:hypothetical protein